MLKRQYILRKYRISYVTLWNMIRRLPDKKKAELKLKPKLHYLKPEQVNQLVKLFGDFESRKFELKSDVAKWYGMPLKSFMKMLEDEFKEDSEVLKTRIYFSPLHQEQIEKKIGKP